MPVKNKVILETKSCLFIIFYISKQSIEKLVYYTKNISFDDDLNIDYF